MWSIFKRANFVRTSNALSFPEYNGIVSRLVNLTKANLDYLELESSSWVQQFREAMNVNGGDLENATFLDYILHFLTFGWKVCLF